MRKQIVLLLAVIVSACGGESEDSAEPGSSYDAAHAAAVAAMDVATQKGHAWLTSDQLIQDAAKAAEEGDESLAISLADEARIHAELAAIQADKEAQAWRDRVISE